MAFSSIDQPESAFVIRDFENTSKEAIIYGAYKQIFGNAYLMEEERAELAKEESAFKLGQSDVRVLILAMGKSAAYRKRFFHRAGPYRFIEMNFKHFLGRGPHSQEEISFHVQKLINEGYEAEIESYILSPEYFETFGLDSVPRFIYKGMYPANDDFNRMNLLRAHWDGCSTSTMYGSTAPGKPTPSRMTMPPGSYCSNPYGIQKGILAGHNPADIKPLPGIKVPLNANAPVRLRVEVAMNHYKVFETDAYMPKPAEPKTSPWEKVLNESKKFNGKYY